MKKYTMKKFIILGIISALTIVSILGCNKSNKSEVKVFAAASLKESLTHIIDKYKEKTKDNILLSFGGSNKLRMQIEEGADADIFLSANEDQYIKLKESGFIESGEALLKNSLVIITPKENKASITSIEDMINRPCKIVLADKEVPIGKYSLKMLDKLTKKYGKDSKEKVLGKVVSYENDVRKVLTKIELNEGDVGIVYKSDIISNKADVNIIEIPREFNVEATYWIGKIKSSKNKSGRDNFYDYIIKNKDIFIDYGYSLAS